MDALTTLITDSDVARWRHDTPGCVSCTHLNNAGASLVPASVHAEVVGHLELETRLGGYEAAALAAPAVARTYASIAALVGAREATLRRILLAPGPETCGTFIGGAGGRPPRSAPGGSPPP